MSKMLMSYERTLRLSVTVESLSTPSWRRSRLVLGALFAIASWFVSAERVLGQTCMPQSTMCLQDLTTCINNPLTPTPNPTPFLNCTSNDVSVITYNVLPPSPTQCVAGENIQVMLQASMLATAQERYDIGLFVALDAGNALTGTCFQDYLAPPLQPSNPPTCAGTCSVSAASCTKDADCPTGQTCNGGYSPTSGTGPFYNGECGIDATDTCGDLQGGVTTLLNLVGPGPGGTLTIPCEDINGDGIADVTTCASWDNATSSGTTNKPSCTSVNGTVPKEKSKCNCTAVNIAALGTPIPFVTPTNTPTNTPTATPTPTATNTPSATPTRTPTNSQTQTPTVTPTPTDTPTNTPTNSPSPSPTNTPTATPTATNTHTQTPTNTPTNTPTQTPSNTPTNSPSPSPTNTPTTTPTATNTHTQTPTNTATSTPTQTPTNTPINSPIASPTNTQTPARTPTVTATQTPIAPASPTVTATFIESTPAPEELTDLAIKKTHKQDFVIGTTASYFVTVTNLGAPSTNPIEVTDVLPTGLTFVSASGAGWNCSGSAGSNVDCTNPVILNMGDQVSLTINVSVGQGVLRNFVNTAKVTKDPNEVFVLNNTSSDPTSIAEPGFASAPVLSPFGLILAVGILAAIGFGTLRRSM